MPSSNPISVQLPDRSILISTHVGTLNLSFLPEASRRVHIFQDNALHSSLLGIGIFTDAGFRVIYDASSVNVLAPSGQILLHGTRDPGTKSHFVQRA